MDSISAGGSTLYLTIGNSNLYKVNTTTGVASFIGPTGTTGGIGGMAFTNSTLYAGVESPLSIDTLNTTTGAGSFVATTSGLAAFFFGMAPIAPVPEPATITALALGALAVLRRRTPSLKDEPL